MTTERIAGEAPDTYRPRFPEEKQTMAAKEVWKAMHMDCLYKSGPGCLLGVGGSSCAFESCLLLKEAKAC